LEDGEEFVGGFAGGFLSRGYIPGYGVYATSRRIIGVALTSTPARQFLGGALAGFVQGQLMPKLSADDSLRVIQELDQKKEFDLRRDQISEIEIKKPGLLSTGRMTITSKAGEKTRISLRYRIAFERLRDLMRAFYPEVVRLI
jgi:hypothetical protein